LIKYLVSSKERQIFIQTTRRPNKYVSPKQTNIFNFTRKRNRVNKSFKRKNKNVKTRDNNLIKNSLQNRQQFPKKFPNLLKIKNKKIMRMIKSQKKEQSFLTKETVLKQINIYGHKL